jgi:putative ABC transport system ATP-binding protein
MLKLEPATNDMADAPPGRVLLRTEQLTKTYTDGNVQALVDANLEILHGEYVAIMGPSGSGKSTLLCLLGALDTPTSGRVLMEGRPFSDWESLDQLRARKIGFVFQSFYLVPTLTSLENVQIPMFGVVDAPRDREEKARVLLGSVGMSDRATHLPSQLSVGQRQRVAIARALANDPPLLLADEPTGNLDSQTADEVLALFDQLRTQREMTLVVVTHSEEVGARAERVIRVRDGRVS